jgi:ABC-type transporter Mla subunit MlaD
LYFLKKLWKFFDQLTATVKELDPTIKLADQSLEKVQAPLDTAVKYSHTLDKVHDKTSEVMGKVADFAAENVDNLKESVAVKNPSKKMRKMR